MHKLVQLTPAQISDHWETLTSGFVSALPPLVTGREALRQTIMLDLASRDLAHVWAAMEGEKPLGYIYTTFVTDPVMQSRNLLIYAVFSVERTTVVTWRESLNTLLKFAKASKCMAVTAYTQELAVINMVNSIGGNAETRFIYKEVL